MQAEIDTDGYNESLTDQNGKLLQSKTTSSRATGEYIIFQ